MNFRILLSLLLLAFAATGCAGVITSSETGALDPLTEPTVEEEPAVEPEAGVPTPTVAPAPTGWSAVTTFCPEVGRPALFLFVPDEEHQLLDPVSGERCALSVLNSEALMPQFGGGNLFYVMRSVDRVGVYRLQPGGEPQALPAASVVIQDGSYADLTYIVSDDGTMIAWAVSKPGEADQMLSDILVAPVSTDEDTPTTALVSQSVAEPRVLQPIRFSADNSVLYYTLAPTGIGGSWIAFTGRYDNLYAAPTAGGPPALIFDCQELALGLCLGDFQVHENEVILLAYTDTGEGAVVVRNGEGQELNRFTPGGDYVGYPTIGLSGELVFYSAELPDESVMPESGTLHRFAPPTAPAEVLAAAPQLVLPQRFLDDDTVVAGYAHDEMTWGLALVSMTGELQVVEDYPNAQLLDVVR